MRNDNGSSGIAPLNSAHESTGLTKREYFAAAALRGLIAKLEMPGEIAAKYAVKAADALLKELEK